MQPQTDAEKDNDNSEHLALRSTLLQRLSEVKVACRKKSIRNVARAVCDAESVDLAFVVDCK